MINIIYGSNCPYCEKLMKYYRELNKCGKYDGLVRFVSENSGALEGYDYYYLPAVFEDHRRIFHGACTKAELRAVLDAAARRL